MNAVIDNKLEHLLDQEYIAIDTFLKILTEANPFPYTSKFSLTPFLKIYENTVSKVCSIAAKETLPRLKGLEEHLATEIDSNEALKSILESVIPNLMPSLFFKNEPVFISAPFQKEFLFATPAMKEVRAEGKWELKLDPHFLSKGKSGDNIFQAGGLILKTFYQQDFDLVKAQVITIRNVETGIEKHFKMSLNFDFVEVEALKPLKKLSQKQIQKLLDHLDDVELWKKTFPEDHFAFKGFGIGRMVDVTELEVMSMLKDTLVITDEDLSSEVFLPLLQNQLKSFLNRADIQVGLVGVTFAEFFENNSFSLTGLNDLINLKRPSAKGDRQGIYHEALQKEVVILKGDLKQIKHPSSGEQILLKNGIRSIMLFPAKDAKGNTTSILEIGSPTPMAFNSLTLVKLKEVFDLLQVGNERYLQDWYNRTSFFIQQQFTSIHPSVEWKFEEVAASHEFRKTLPGFNGEIEPIVFDNLYPLYGQADIVSSSKKRNASIRADLIDNLRRVQSLMQNWISHLDFHLLDAYLIKVQQLLVRLEKEFISSDENEVVDLLTSEVHPLLKKLIERFKKLPQEPYEEYLNALDSDLNIIYRQRKDYEQSVSRLNQAISNYIEKDDERMQKILPHYFEKYKTDGVEYNLYLGQSIVPNIEFGDFYIKDFRLWQLVQMCEITRLVDSLATELPVPLKTAQLVFVYGTPLSIRFRMDEKQFDVDGTYNVRYEILKKRIDKAVIKGTKERLTVAGKVAIVYLQEHDRREYLEYIDYLIGKGYIEKEYEDLELEKLQGAEGLKALRLTVKTGS